MENDLTNAIRDKIDQKTKPLGALGVLEKLAFRIASVQRTLTPKLSEPHIVVFAGSHGIAREGVSAYPAEVTAQMVLNFLGGGAAINVFSRQHNMRLKIVDAGVDFDFAHMEGLVDAKQAFGTQSFLTEKAMTGAQCRASLEKGAEIVGEIHQTGCNVVGFGEMGIGNTSPAAVIMSRLLDLPLADCIGRGTGLNDAQMQKKQLILQQAIDFHQDIQTDPLTVLQTFGGFEMAMITGAMLEAARRDMLVLVDGFIASVAFLTAFQVDNRISDCAVFCHQSEEKGHKLLLEKLHAEPVLRLNMRLGEGTGCAVAYPLLVSAVAFMNEMASFESARVSQKSL